MTEAPPTAWRFYKIGLLVTGRGEEKFLPKLFRALTDSGTCHFQVLRKIDQRSPPTSTARLQKMVGTRMIIPTKDEEDIGFEARKWLGAGRDNLLLLVDDLEGDRRAVRGAVFDRYRKALDTMLRPGEECARASVHFLVNMLEAYYFAHADAVNAVLGTSLTDHEGDVEEIRHPKRDLKRRHPGFDEVEHGERIVRELDAEWVLRDPETCASLRTLFAWCVVSTGGELGARFCLDSGVYDVTTGPQLGRLTSLLPGAGARPVARFARLDLGRPLCLGQPVSPDRGQRICLGGQLSKCRGRPALRGVEMAQVARSTCASRGRDGPSG